MRILECAAIALLVGAGGALGQIRANVEEVRKGSDQALAYLAARDVVPLTDGSRLVMHIADLDARPPSVVATLIGPNGLAIQRITAVDSLHDRQRPGSLGQVRWGAYFGTSHRLALTLGWVNPAGTAENGIALWKRKTSGLWTPDRLLPVEGGLGSIAEGPEGTLLTTSFNVARFTKDSGPPRLTLFDSTGVVLGEFLPRPPTVTPSEAAQDALRSTIVRLGPERYALLDFRSETIKLLRITRITAKNGRPFTKDFRVSQLREIPVGGRPDEIEPDRSGIKAFCILPDESVVVVRTGRGSSGKTVLSRYRGDRRPESGALLTSHWQTAWCEPGQVTGSVALRGEEVVLEHVSTTAVAGARMPESRR
jgi:hypothetical protein